MSKDLLPKMTKEMAEKRRTLAPDVFSAWREFGKAVFADGALPSVTKQLIAVAVAHTTQCAYCIKGHTREAIRQGATHEQLMETIWVAAEMRAGGAYAHSAVALQEMLEEEGD